MPSNHGNAFHENGFAEKKEGGVQILICISDKEEKEAFCSTPK